MANQFDQVFSAIADPTRRAVIERLVQGPAAVSELHAPHDMALPSFLTHLNKLEKAGLVHTIKRGRTRMVYIETAPLMAAEDWLDRQRAQWTRRLDRLAALAETLEQEKP